MIHQHHGAHGHDYDPGQKPARKTQPLRGAERPWAKLWKKCLVRAINPCMGLGTIPKNNIVVLTLSHVGHPGI